MSVLHVGRVSGAAKNLPSTRCHILEKSHISVLSVEKPFVKYLISRNTRGSIREKSPISVQYVGRVSRGAHILPPISSISIRGHSKEKRIVSGESLSIKLLFLRNIRNGRKTLQMLNITIHDPSRVCVGNGDKTK